MRAAKSLSFLKHEDQKIFEKLLIEYSLINMKQTEMIKTHSKESKLIKTSIDEILKPENYKTQVTPVKLSSQDLSKYFKLNQSVEKIN